jgi:glycosyltransferase involved in cell wall biosynthesis
VQSIIPGPNSSHYLVRAYIDESNQPLALYTGRKIRQYPTDFGDASCLETIADAEVTALGLTVLQRIQYRGLGGSELKRDARTGALQLIEINGRLGQNNIIGTRAGINLPLIAYLHLTGQQPAPALAYRAGVRYVVIGKDFRAFRAHARDGQLGALQWLRELATVSAFPHFAVHDPLPFLVATGRGVRRRLRALAGIAPLTSDLRAAATPAHLRAPGNRLRALHFRSTFTFAGPERGLLTLAAPLRAHGIDGRIIAYYRRRPPEPPVHRLVEEGRREGLDVQQWEDSSWFSWRTVRRLARELAGGGYDLLVSHDHKANLIGRLAARRARTPCLAVAHGYDLSLRRMHLYRRLDLLTLRRFARVVAVSDSVRRELVAAGLRAERVAMVPTAIDVARFADHAVIRSADWRRRWAEPGAPVVLTVGRLYRQKGLEDFVEAARHIHRALPGVRVWIVGEGVLRERLAARIRSLGLEDVVTLLGQQDDVAAVMAASDVFVSPSLGEGLSNALLEAMALARPVVATRVGGTPEVVQEGETGWLVPPRQPEALARAVLGVLGDPDGAARVGARGRAFVATRFSSQSVAPRMAEVYRQAVAAGARR